MILPGPPGVYYKLGLINSKSISIGIIMHTACELGYITVKIHDVIAKQPIRLIPHDQPDSGSL